MKELIGIGRVHDLKHFYAHSHNVWEVVYYTRGNVTLTIGGVPHCLQAGCLAFQPPEILHSEYSKDGYSNIFFTVRSFDTIPPKTNYVYDMNGQPIMQLLLQINQISNSRPDNWRNISEKLLDTVTQYVLSLIGVKNKNKYVECFLNVLIDNISRSDFQLNEAMKNIPLSPDYFRVLFKNETGCTPIEYLTKLRIRNAKDILGENTSKDLTNAAIAKLCGYDDPYYFSRVFRKVTGQSPSVWYKQKHTM